MSNCSTSMAIECQSGSKKFHEGYTLGRCHKFPDILASKQQKKVLIFTSSLFTIHPKKRYIDFLLVNSLSIHVHSTSHAILTRFITTLFPGWICTR